MESINRISIIGAPGSGKTTLAKDLKKIYKLPVIHIDSIHHLRDWKLREKSERDKIILENARKEKWIMDGTFFDTLAERVSLSDKIIYLRYPTHVNLFSAIKRMITHLNKERDEIPGCKDRIDFSFLAYVATYNFKMRKRIEEILKDVPKDKIIIFNNRRELNKWLKDQ